VVCWMAVFRAAVGIWWADICVKAGRLCLIGDCPEWRAVKEAFSCFRATDVRFWPKDAVLLR